MFVIAVFFFICNLLIVARSQSCSSDRMRTCKENVLRNIEKRINDMNRQDMSQHCGVVREDFNCLLRQTRCLTNENERQRNADAIRKGLVYIRDGCDSLGGGWRESSCYIGDGMKSCENSYPISGGQYSSYSTETCRKFNLFHECVTHNLKTLDNRCRPQDDRLIGQYLVDRAQDLAWNCGTTDRDRDRDRDGYVRDRERDGRYGSDRYGSDRNRDRDNWRSDTTSDRDRYDRDRDRDRNYDRDRYGGDRNYDGGYAGDGDITCCRNERCDRTRMERCRDSLTRAVDSRTGGYQDSQKCKRIRDDFNCLLWQTTCLPREERDRASDIFRRAKDYISRYCDTYGRLSENSCYKSNEMQRCESYLSNTRAGATYEACRSYNSFRNCMTEELRRRCTREDELLQGSYLTEKAQEMSWQCSNENMGSSDTQYNQYPSSSQDRRYPYNSASAFGAYDNYDDNTHLNDDDEMCRSRMQSLADNCKSELDEKRRQTLTYNDNEWAERRKCCTARQFRTCLYDASRRVCSQEKGRVVEYLLGRQRHELNSDSCRRIYDSDCSSAFSVHISSALLAISLLILATIT